MVISNALLGLVLLGGIGVDVKPLAGPSQQGELEGFEESAVILLRDGQPQRLPMLGLWEIRPIELAEPPATLPAVWVELVDGSELQARGYRVTDRMATITLTTGQTLDVRTRSIRTVRFRDHSASPTLSGHWQQITSERHSGDVIVIRRQESLDHLEGILLDVADETVTFDFDGERIEVNRQRLDGLVYYHAIDRQLPDRVCQVTDVAGSRWNARSLALADGQIRVDTVAGIRYAFPVEQLRKLDFSSGNTVWLSDLEPEFVQRTPYVASRLPAPALERLFQPRRDVGMTGKPLMLDGVSYDKGLAMTSRTEIVFRLTDDYSYFHAMVGIDDHVRDGGDVDLVISGDDQVLLSRTVTGREPAFPVELDISGVRRLRILVDFGRGMDVADHLNLGDARITK